jgi:hypothetical protein
VISGDIDVSCLPIEIERVEKFKAVGVPVGDEEFVSEFLELKKQKLFELINKIQDYLQGHADHAFHLIRSCINTIGSYIGRIIMPNTFENFATDFDQAINRCIAFFIGKESISNVAKLIRQLPAKTGGNGLYSLTLTSKIGFAYSWIAARNTFGPGFWNGIDLERKEAVAAIFPDSNLTQNFIIDVTQRETFARYLIPIQEKILNILKDGIMQDLPGYAWVKSVFEKKVEQFWINSIFTKVFNADGSPVALSNENFIIMWRYSLLDDFVPNVSHQLLCSCARNPPIRIRDPTQKYHSLSCQQGDQIHRHDDIAKTLEKVVLYHGKDLIQSVYVPRMVGVSRYTNTNCTFKGDLALSITLMNGEIGNFNVDISVINQSSSSYFSKPIDSILKTREDYKVLHYSRVVNNAGFDRLVPFVISTSGALGDKAKNFLNDVLIPRLDPRGEIGFARKLMRSIAFTMYNHICTETISYNRRINSVALKNNRN